MKNSIQIFAFSKQNKSAEKRFDKWLSYNGINGQSVKVWSVDHGHNFKGRTRYITTVEIEVNGAKFKLTAGTDYSQTYDAWNSVDSDSSFKVDRAKNELLGEVMNDWNVERITQEIADQQEQDEQD